MAQRKTNRETVEDLDDKGNVVNVVSDIEEVRTTVDSGGKSLRATVVAKIDYVQNLFNAHIEFNPTNDKPAKFKRLGQEDTYNKWQNDVFEQYNAIKQKEKARMSKHIAPPTETASVETTPIETAPTN